MERELERWRLVGEISMARADSSENVSFWVTGGPSRWDIERGLFRIFIGWLLITKRNIGWLVSLVFED
jgi:hypothetical protein